jgi:sulfite reductase (NADPH) hemoprotein beta-component
VDFQAQERPSRQPYEQMRLVADLAERYSFAEIRVTHHQILVLPHVKLDDVPDLFAALQEAGLAAANLGLASDIIACPGMDYCSLATARSIPIAQSISRRFADLAHQHDVGPLRINISGCINACGHHHVGHIGILGVDKKGSEWYQVSLGGSSGRDATLGQIIGPSFAADEVPDVIERIIEIFLEHRVGDEPFLACFRRIGIEPFKERVYGKAAA